jgi:PAS domain S-box-containing protein
MSLNRETQTQIILDSIADGVFTVDSDWKITSFNKAAEKITGIKKDEAVGRHCWDVFRASICETSCSLKQTMESGDPVVDQAIFVVNFEGERVPVSISTALLQEADGTVIGGVETFRDLTVVEELRKALGQRHSYFDIISKNGEMHRLFQVLEQVAPTNSTVLLQGESGTGKELFARAIHSLSPRKDGPLVTINCGALPDSLLESELFGYKAGAFTDARKDKAGRLALAEKGTLFLDEIGDISPALQVRLLRVLQDRIYEPLGSTKQVRADVRIVAATNQDLEKLVEKGRFRQDLYYRINVVRLFLPPLRDRKEDIPLLADHFIRKYNRLNKKDIKRLSPEALALLMAHDFPGNIRELENILEYASVVSRNSIVDPKHLPGYLFPPDAVSAGQGESAVSRHASWKEVEKGFILASLRKNNWNRAATAQDLGIHPTTLWRRMKRLHIQTRAT